MTAITDLIAEYGDPIELLDHVPRTATELFYAWAGVAPEKSLSRRERNVRKFLAMYLTRKSLERRDVTRAVITDNGRTRTAFWRTLDPGDAEGHRPGVPGQDAPLRAVGNNGQLSG